MTIAIVMIAATLPLSAPAFAQEIKTQETSFFADLFNQNVYYEGTNFLHLDRLYRFVAKKKLRSLDVNAYDEVPDSAFFVNRHARKPLSAEELAKGPAENEGPDFSNGLTITQGKFNGLHPGFFIKDSKGGAYFLKFDSEDSLELQTSADSIASRFFHAIGYSVPQYTIATFTLKQVSIAPSATVYDDTGFQKKLTQERFEQYITFVPQDEEGRYRASARKTPAGEDKGVFRFQGRRSADPQDKINHDCLRALRALRVFGSWLGEDDLREGNTQDLLVSDNGKPVLKHYLMDFQDALGSSSNGAKPPMATHEYFVDYGDTGKAIFSFGFWKKPWQKRWKDTGENLMSVSPAVGYFDNRYFDPAKYKTQLPHYAFKDLTRADALWATKIIMSFSDENIRAIVKTGKLSKPEDSETVAKVLIERRDLIGKYGFETSSPLEDFSLQNQLLSFKDLAIDHKFWTTEQTTYHVDLVNAQGKNLSSADVHSPTIDLGSSAEVFDAVIHTVRSGSKAQSAHVRVQIRSGRIAGIIHQD
ncbi:MAG: hypothetical protein EXS63_02465 [Candidatus Omnitrophica bacterium]|nr:hypothetical protein [Candidatus Omnitrophota bacterium]